MRPDTQYTPFVRFVQGCFLAFLFLLPWQTRWIAVPAAEFEYARLSIYATDLLLAALAAAGAVLPARSFYRAHRRAWYALAGYGMLAVASFAWAGSVAAGAYKLALIAKSLLVLWVWSRISVSFLAAALAIIAGIAIQAGMGVVQFFLQQISGNTFMGIAEQIPSRSGTSVIEVYPEGALPERWLRAYGGLPHPNIAGAYFAVALVLALGTGRTIARKGSGVVQKIAVDLVRYGTLVVLSAGLFVTFSRGAWIAAAFGIAIWLAICLRGKMRCRVWAAKAVGSALVPFLFLSILFWPLVSVRFSGEERLEVWSQVQRSSSIREGIQALTERPFTGRGAGSIVMQGTGEPPHNAWIVAGVELGFPGLVLLVFFLAAVTRASWRRRTECAAVGAAWGSIMFMTAVDHFWWTLHSGVVLLAAVSGLVLYGLPSEDTFSYGREKNSSSSSEENPRRMGSGSTSALV